MWISPLKLLFDGGCPVAAFTHSLCRKCAELIG